MKSQQKSVTEKGRRDRSSDGRPALSLGEKAVTVLVAERKRFHRFLASRVGDDATADDLLQESLRRALERGDTLRRNESAVAWFYRILRNAVSDHFRKTGSEKRRTEKLLADMQARGDEVDFPSADWDAAVCACFRGLLPSLKPRYAEVIHRVDLRGESKFDVGRDMKIKRGTMDVLLHRARSALRQQLETFCGACSRESCLACYCQPSDRSRKAAGVGM